MGFKGDHWSSADVYDVFSSKIQRLNAEVLASMSNPCADSEILDLGCGTGAFLELMSDKVQPAKVVGVDVSADMLRRAKHVNYGCPAEFHQATMLDLDFEEDFDIIGSNAALHWAHPDIDTAVAIMVKALRNGGEIVVATAGRNSTSDRWEALFSELLQTTDAQLPNIPFGERRRSPQELRALFSSFEGVVVEDSFLIEREFPSIMTEEEVISWLISSGAPWTAPPSDIDAFCAKLRSSPILSTIRHWTSVIVAKKQPLN